MAQFHKSISLPDLGGTVEATVALLTSHRNEDYYAYEHGNTWHIGLRSYASLVVNPGGTEMSRIHRDGKREICPINRPLNDIARAFVLEYSDHGKIFGQVGFNYSAHISGQTYLPGQWPLLSLMVPCVQVAISPDSITVKGYMEDEARAVFDSIQACLKATTTGPVPESYPPIDLHVDSSDYKIRVSRAVLDIEKGKYIKAIPSRKVCLPKRVDMLSTLLHGRRANTPARSFTLNHLGIQATGFSPEVLLSVDNDTAFTEALAGTRLSDGQDIDPMRNKLLNDPKEVMEHVITIKGSVRRLSHLCIPGSVAVKQFMSIMPRGNVHHLFSHVTGSVSPGKDGWDALPALVANITVPGLPKEANMEAIQAFEPCPRDLYCGAVLMLDGTKFFEAALVLRTVFQDSSRQWLQAGAGVTALSKPEREFTETCEKLGSIAPYVVPEVREN